MRSAMTTAISKITSSGTPSAARSLNARSTSRSSPSYWSRAIGGRRSQEPRALEPVDERVAWRPTRDQPGAVVGDAIASGQQALDRALVLEEGADRSEREPARLQPTDALEPLEVLGPVAERAPDALGRREQAFALVVADGVDRHAGSLGQVVDAPAVLVGAATSGSSLESHLTRSLWSRYSCCHHTGASGTAVPAPGPARAPVPPGAVRAVASTLVRPPGQGSMRVGDLARRERSGSSSRDLTHRGRRRGVARGPAGRRRRSAARATTAGWCSWAPRPTSPTTDPRSPSRCWRGSRSPTASCCAPPGLDDLELDLEPRRACGRPRPRRPRGRARPRRAGGFRRPRHRDRRRAPPAAGDA